MTSFDIVCTTSIGRRHYKIALDLLFTILINQLLRLTSRFVIIRGEPERTPNTRDTGSGFIIPGDVNHFYACADIASDPSAATAKMAEKFDGRVLSHGETSKGVPIPKPRSSLKRRTIAVSYPERTSSNPTLSQSVTMIATTPIEAVGVSVSIAVVQLGHTNEILCFSDKFMPTFDPGGGSY